MPGISTVNEAPTFPRGMRQQAIGFLGGLRLGSNNATKTGSLSGQNSPVIVFKGLSWAFAGVTPLSFLGGDSDDIVPMVWKGLIDGLDGHEWLLIHRWTRMP